MIHYKLSKGTFKVFLVLYFEVFSQTGTNLKYFNILFWLKLVVCCTISLGNIFGNLITDTEFFTDIPIGGLCARQDYEGSAWTLKSPLMSLALLSVIEFHIIKFTFSIKRRTRKARTVVTQFGKYQRNLLTMDQTQCLGTIIFLHQALVVLILSFKTLINSLLTNDQLFFLLILSYLVILDVSLGFLAPLFLLLRSEEIFPELWRTNNKISPEGPNFYVIEPTIKPRRDIELKTSDVQLQVLHIEVQPVPCGNSGCNSGTKHDEESSL